MLKMAKTLVQENENKVNIMKNMKKTLSKFSDIIIIISKVYDNDYKGNTL